MAFSGLESIHFMETYQYYLLKSLTRWRSTNISPNSSLTVPFQALPTFQDIQSEIGRYSIFSFDLESLLRRDVEPPDYPKRHVSFLLSLILSKYDLDVSVESLSSLRQEAEALTNYGSLKDMFARMYSLVQASFQVDLADHILLDELVEYEIFSESQHFRSIPGAKDLLREIKASGAKIVLLSDMRFSAGQLQVVLENSEILGHIDHVVMECEYCLSKTSGNLFEKLIDEGILQPGLTLHVGPDYIGDFVQPKKRGLDACLLLLREEEKNWRVRRQELRLGNLFGDFASLRPGLFRADAGPLSTVYDIGYYRLGPVFTLFALELAKRAVVGGYHRTIFLARDGYIFLHLYELFMRHWRPVRPIRQPATDYVYLSRASTYAAGSDLDTNAVLSLAQRVNRHEGLGALFSILGLDLESYRPLITEIVGSELNSDLEHSGDSMAVLLNHPKFQQEISFALNQKKNLLSEYLHQHRLIDCEEKQLWVDIGWNGSIFKYLEKCIGEKFHPRIDVMLFGRTYGSQTQKFNLLPGVIYDQKRTNPLELLIFEHRELLEAFVSSGEGSVLGYHPKGNRVVPLLAPTSAEPFHSKTVGDLQAGILSWCSDFIELLNHFCPNVESFRPMALIEIGKLLTGHHPEEMALLGNIQVDLNWGSAGRVSLDEFMGPPQDANKDRSYQAPITEDQLRIHLDDSHVHANPQKLLEKLHHLVEVLKKEKRIVVYGVGTVAALLSPLFLNKIDFFVDGNSGLWDKTFLDRKIRNPDELVDCRGRTVFITPIGRKNTIKHRLKNFDLKLIFVDDHLN